MKTDIIISIIDPTDKKLTHSGHIMDQIHVEDVAYIMAWYSTGMPKSYATFDDNRNGRGIAVEWYEDGSVKEYYFHVEGLRHGEYRSWDDGGNMTARKLYINGRCIYSKSEIPREERSFMSMQHGKIFFIEDNEILDFTDDRTPEEE